MDFRRMTRVYWVVWAVVALVGGLVVGGPVSAQTPTASIVGTVLDPQGLPVEGANVTLTNQGTNYTYNTTTSSTGAFQFSSIDSGIYRVTVIATGFRLSVVQDIKTDAATNYSIPPIKLEVGPSKESITVVAGAEIVNTTDTEVSSTVEKRQIEALPILDRNPLNLLSLQAGVNSSGPNANNVILPTDTVINGQRTTYSNLTLDGINIQDNFIRENALDFSPNQPFSSQAQEFTVINQNAGVDNGGGSSQVSIITPKGTNNWHGQGFWNYRTNAWAANDWFNDASGTPNPNLLRNQGGGNIGGPILKDKLFIYGWYELLRLRQQAVNNTTVISPTIFNALNGTGTLPAACGSVSPCLPFTYTPVDSAGNPDPAGARTINLLNFTNNSGQNFAYTVDPAMLALIQRVPAAKTNNTRVGDGVNLLGYQLNARSNDTRDNYGWRVDYNLNSHNTITGTWAWNREIVDRPDIDTSYDTVPLVSNNDKEKFLSIGWRWSPSGTITNEARFGFNLAPAFFLTNQKFGSYIVDQTDPITGGTLVPFTLPDPNFLPQGRNTRTWTGLDNASFTKGNHTIKFGGSVSRITIATTDSAGTLPDYQVGFSSKNKSGFQASDMPGTVTLTDSFSGSQADYANAAALATSVAGILSTVSQTFNATSQTSGYQVAPLARNYRQNQFAIYAADTWRVNPRLTVNYGLRWDYYGPVDERDGLVLLPEVTPGLNISQTLLGNATVNFAGGNSPRGLYGGYWKAFSPNIGIAWDPFGNGKTAVRAGFSFNYVNDEFFTAADNAAVGNTGLGATSSNSQLFGPTVSNPLGKQTVSAPPFQIPIDFNTNAFNATNTSGTIGSLAGYGIDPHLKPPQVQQWNLSIQRDIGWSTSLQVSYVGNHGVGLFRAIDVNQLNYNAPAVCTAPVLPAPCPTDTFFQDFQAARAAGFASLAAGQGFNPLYNCPMQQTSSTCLPFFNFIYGGALGVPFINNYIQQGQIGQLIAVYHADEFDTGIGAYPGQANLVNWFPNPYIMGGDLLKNASFSNYNAGIVEVRRRFSKGLYFQANYTFSKVMTNYGPSNNIDQTRFNPLQDNARPFLERSRAPFDLTHAFKANFTYELPIGRGHHLFGSPNRAMGLLVNGWQTGSIFTWQSGSPFSIVSQYATFNRTTRSHNNTAIATLTHQQISGDLGVFEQPNGVVYLINPKLISPDGTGAPSSPQLGGCTPAVTGGFCNPQPGEVGNLQQFAFNAPPYFVWNMTASKDFNVTEKVKLNFRTDAFNLTNHPVFAVQLDPVTSTANFNINSTTFGQSTRTISAPRVLQMQLMLTF